MEWNFAMYNVHCTLCNCFALCLLDYLKSKLYSTVFWFKFCYNLNLSKLQVNETAMGENVPKLEEMADVSPKPEDGSQVSPMEIAPSES